MEDESIKKSKKKKIGYIIETANGREGKIFVHEPFIDGKIVVNIDGLERPMLCKPNTIKITGRFEH
jgi:hypothetical protein